MTPTTPALLAPVALTDGAVPMSPSEALDIVHELACLSQLDDLEASGDGLLKAQARWQRAALDRLGLVVHEHPPAIDAHLALPSLALCAPVADWLGQPERDMDPELPFNAVRICLELAQDAALEAHECGTEPVLVVGRADGRGRGGRLGPHLRAPARRTHGAPHAGPARGARPGPGCRFPGSAARAQPAPVLRQHLERALLPGDRGEEREPQEDGEGAYGTVTLDVAARTIVLDHNGRLIESEHSAHSF